MKTLTLNNFEIGKDKLTVFAGPCAMESEEICFTTAEKLIEITKRLNINFIFKTSFDKANRSSLKSYRGLGLERGLKILSKIKKELNVPIVTDIH